MSKTSRADFFNIGLKRTARMFGLEHDAEKYERFSGDIML
ncbi:hypothetical protein RLPCCGM1_c0626 [Rhizobium leguminosarum bv. phaseoli CCGM1]|nr:hypothetical protein RLPCCGM1_c0626 [Rhizobium leguminosarum bv. phaseoli CCGM1]